MRRISVASDKPDELRKKGYSKDGKHNRVQVVLDGLPVGYELFEGNTADVKTLEPAIVSLKARLRWTVEYLWRMPGC